MSRLFSKFSKKSPLEVGRFISMKRYYPAIISYEFPSPLEVGRFISYQNRLARKRHVNGFPSPREVYRFISVIDIISIGLVLVSVHFRGG